MNTFIYLLIWFAVLALFVYIVTRPRPSKALVNDKILHNQLKSCKFDLTTKKGAKLKSAFPSLSNEMTGAIDKGFDEFERSLPRNGYSQIYDRSKNLIYVIEPDRKGGGEYGVPDFKVQLPAGSEYIGSVYDHVDPITGQHFIYAAERVLDERLDKSVNKWIVCNVDDNFQNVVDAVRFGAEHCFLYLHDKQKYYETESHLTGGHPLLK